MTALITVGQAGTGPRNASTDSQGLRTYLWQGRALPSVTTVRRMAGVPHSLHQWAISQVVDRAVDDHAGIGAQLATGTPQSIDAVRTHLRRAATDERDRRAQLGTAVHEAAAARLPLSQVGSEIAPYLRQDLDWLRLSGAEVLLAERQVWNLEVGYAGTFDRLVRFPDGSVWVVDIKTGKGTYGEHALQLMAYLMAEFVGEDDQVDESATELLRQASGMAVLHLRARSWEFTSVAPTPETWRAFRGLLLFAEWAHAHPSIDDVALGARKGSA